MPGDEQKIRDLIAVWIKASTERDLPKILQLMSEDAVFLLPGQPPMRGRTGFAEMSAKAGNDFQISIASDIQELKVFGDYAYCWSQLIVDIMPKQSRSLRRKGPVLTIFQKEPSGNWVLARDANMLTIEAA